MSNVVVLLFMLALGCAGEAPCTAVCESDCELTVVCADRSPPTGDAYDACVDACVEFVVDAGVASEEECHCDDAESCAATPPGQFIEGYTC